MSRVVDLSKPLSKEDEAYLKERSRQADIDENKRVLAEEAGDEPEEPEEPEFKQTYTVAAPPIEPGSAADNPPRFVGTRPYGVDRAVWGGTTGLSEQEGYAATAGEPHEEQVELVNQDEVEGQSETEETSNPEDLTVDELKDELRERELPLDGNKAELVKRLKKALKEDK